MIELLVAMSILIIAVLPLAYSFHRERAVLHRVYHRSVLIEWIDGEMELLVAGEWKAFGLGESPYPISATGLPAGTATLRRTTDVIRLDWKPAPRSKLPPLHRETRLR